MTTIKSYLIIEKGAINEEVFPLGSRGSIGRDKENHICLSDPAVSKQHAVYYIEDGNTVVEDVGSYNGTFVNGKRVKKSILSSGDILLIGGVTLRFFQGDKSQEQVHIRDTSEFDKPNDSKDLTLNGISTQSRRLIEAISKVPLFTGLGEEDLTRLSQVARLMLFDQGSTIIKQGDLGRSLYIILDGSVQVITYDNQGREILVSFLTENQFFGEISFLSGGPRPVTVQVMEEALLCQLDLDSMQEVMQNSPAVKEMIEECYRERLKVLEGKKQEAGFMERRKQLRYNVEFHVDFHFSPNSRIPDKLEGRLFHAKSSEISSSGIQINAQNPRLLDLPVNSEIRLEIFLPQPTGSIHCLGILKSIAEKKGEVNSVFLSIEFAEMSSAHRKKFELFLSDQIGPRA